MHDLVLTHGGPRLAIWWTTAALFGWAGVARWRRRGSRLGPLILMMAAAYVGVDYTPSLAREKIIVMPDRLWMTAGRWYRPLTMQWSLGDVVRAYEIRNPHRTVIDRYVILETADYERRRFRQTDLFRRHREAIFQALEARSITVERAP